MKPTYEQLEKSRYSWKSVAEALTMFIRLVKSGDGSQDQLVSEIAKLSEWNAKHIEENDKLKLEIAELEQALTGRTLSCAFCNQTAKERDASHSRYIEVLEDVREFVRLELALQLKSCPKDRMDWTCAFARLEDWSQQE